MTPWVYWGNLRYMEEVYLTVSDIAHRLQFTKKRIYQLIQMREMRGTNIGTGKRPAWRVTEQDFREFLRARNPS